MVLIKPTTTINIFGLPPVLDSIYENLDTQHINTCRLVCKEWSVLFEVYRWRTIDFEVPYYPHGPKRPPAYSTRGPHSFDSIRRHSSRVWDLTIPLAELATFLDEPDQEDVLSNLRSLCLREGDYYHNDITAINRVFEFISKASRLQELLAHRITGYSHQHSDFVLSSFALHPALTTLILGGPMSRSSPIFALAILKNCPPSLRYLSVECLCDGDDEYEKALEAAAVIQESEQRYDWKRLESLKELAIACRSGGCESWVHIPLLKNSPHLKLLSVGNYDGYNDPEADHDGFRQVLNTAPVVCPGIERLSVAQGERDPLAAADLVRLIQAYPRGLKSFRIAMPLSDQDHVISALLQTSGTTLERVYLEYGEHTPPSTVNSINRFVQDFPQLDEMDMQCHCRHSRSCQHNELRAYVRDQGKPYHGLDAF
ncbi:hypothetical protein BGX33_003667 [Mortierella sp. NVP41]|nr:hypothetical protein BGX33_003667 [Mortierella sp. NVP41]